MNHPVWQADHVRVTAQDRVLLDIPRLRLPEGQTVAIIGPNGAGKSTLLRVLMGEFRDIAVTCDGQAVQQMVARGKIARVGQHERFELPLTLTDYVLLGRFPHLSWFARPGQDDIAAAHDLLREFELFELKDKRITTLSGGEQQRAAIIRALLQDTEFLLLDEPSNHLDIRHQHRLLGDLIQRKRARRLNIVMVLHDLNLAAHYADYVLLLNHGKLIAHGSPTEVMTEERLSAVYDWTIRAHQADGLFFAAVKR